MKQYEIDVVDNFIIMILMTIYSGYLLYNIQTYYVHEEYAIGYLYCSFTTLITLYMIAHYVKFFVSLKKWYHSGLFDDHEHAYNTCCQSLYIVINIQIIISSMFISAYCYKFNQINNYSLSICSLPFIKFLIVKIKYIFDRYILFKIFQRCCYSNLNLRLYFSLYDKHDVSVYDLCCVCNYCNILLKDNDNVNRTICGHKYHSICFEYLITKNDICVKCNTNLISVNNNNLID